MRRVVVTEFVSLDGVIEEPAWSAPYWSDDIAPIKQEELFAAGALLLGRKTYEGFAAAWPGRTDEDGYADRINAMPKHVASRMLTEPAWNARVIEGDDVAAAVARLKREEGEGGDLLVFGSGELVQALIANNLVDEWRLLVYPVVLGAGKRLFGDGSTASLRLVETRALPFGVVFLRYEPAGEAATA